MPRSIPSLPTRQGPQTAMAAWGPCFLLVARGNQISYHLRNLGPVASGMPEVLVASAALAVPELDGKVALISDTRVSGVSHGAIGVHCAPEAAVGGPIAFVHDGDEISFDLLAGTCKWHIADEELAHRRSEWTFQKPPPNRGYLADFAATVTQANRGCVSQALHPQE